jgi:mucin-19
MFLKPWLSLLKQSVFRRTRRSNSSRRHGQTNRQSQHSRLIVTPGVAASPELLEDRTLLAAFVESGGGTVLTITLNAASDTVHLSSSGSSYRVTANSSWTGTDNTRVTGNGTTTLTVTATGVSAYSTINITDTAGNGTVEFDDSGVNAFAASINATLDNAGAVLFFNGSTSFSGSAGLTAIVAKQVTGISVGITTSAGAISITANQSGAATGNFVGVEFINSTITTSSGNIALNGTGGNTDSDQGVVLFDSTVTTATGDISITGKGGSLSSGTFQQGVFLSNGAVQTTGTGATAGDITINGTVRNGASDASGVYLTRSSHISSIDGDVSVTGTGAGANSPGNTGLFVRDNSVVETTGDGNVTVVGSTTASGSIPGIRGESGGSFRAKGSGALSLTGTASNSGEDISFDTEAGSLGDAAGTGSLTLNANTVQLGDVQVRGLGALTIRPRTAATSIGLGGGSGTLNLTDTELGFLQDGFSSITIGSATAGDITINTASFSDSINLVTGGKIHDSTGTDVMVGSTDVVMVSGTLAPGQSPGITSINGDFAFANNSTFEVEIGGTSPATTPASNQHDQLSVTNGSVAIGTGVTLSTLAFNGFGPALSGGETFRIIDVVGAGETVTGTFAGLPEGATISNFLGSGLDATITYAGGTGGNDVVLTVIPHDTFVTLSGGALTITDVNGNTSNDSLTISYSGGTYTITDTNGLTIGSSIAGATGSGTATVTVPDTGVTSIVINTLGGNDTVTISSVQPSLSGGFTINAGLGTDTVNLNGDVTLGSGANLAVTAETVNTGANADLITSGTGTISITADDVALNATSTLQSAGTVSFVTQTAARPINVGTQTAGSLSLTDAELDRITSGTTQIGAASSGAITVSSAITHTNNLTISTDGGVTLSQALTLAADRNLSVNSTSTAAGITLSNGNADITTSGTGNISLTSTRNISVGSASIQSQNGDVTLLANASGTTSGNFVGVRLFGTGTIVTTTGSGSVSLTGTGGSGDAVNNNGVEVTGAAVVSSGGAGSVSLHGTGGAGSLGGNNGVSINGSNTLITSGGGHIFVTGVGGGVGNFNLGVSVFSQADIVGGGATGNVTIHGTGGTGTGFGNTGVQLFSVSGQVLVTSGGGNVQVTGLGGSNPAGGVSIGIVVDSGSRPAAVAPSLSRAPVAAARRTSMTEWK